MSELEQYQTLVSRFFSLLETTEESETGKIFRPFSLGCCRVQLSKEMDDTLIQLKRLTEGKNGE